jgi:hypothetical protein
MKMVSRVRVEHTTLKMNNFIMIIIYNNHNNHKHDHNHNYWPVIIIGLVMGRNPNKL